MRRGLMGWSETDLPAAVLRQRLSFLQTELRKEGLGGLVLYTNVARPAAVSFLTGFTPYWSEGLLLVPASGEPVLATALSNRVSAWIRSVMPIGSIENTPRPAATIGRKLAEANIGKVGVLELDLLSATQAALLMANDGALALEDATALFRAVRLRVDAPELELVRRADELARHCLQTFARTDNARLVAADIEARARRAGAEEVFVWVNPDLGGSNAFLRCDRLDALGANFAIRLSLALKGSWVRRTITRTRMSEQPRVLADADAAFERALASGSIPAALKALRDGFPGKIMSWAVEACIGSYPLEVVACSGGLPAYSGTLPIGVVSVQAEINETTWHAAGPVIGEVQLN
ncbi:MAG: aminopeptidase P family N-terminal domain-containing protein [Bradyrhizobiaceae bacterium]|nr:aminopeptidase P family N-terminal domain-containing protein [Bradyrhizobiaceae bacterium]